MFTVTKILPLNIAVHYLITGTCSELADITIMNHTGLLKRVFLLLFFIPQKLVLEMEWYVATLVLFYGSLFLELCLASGSVLFPHRGSDVNRKVVH